LLKLFESFDQLRDSERVRPGVFRIAKNAGLMKRRKSVFVASQKLSVEQFLAVGNQADGQVKIEIADWSHLPDDQVLQSEMKQVLDRAMGDLPENYRAVILLRDLEELSTEATAQIVDVTEDTVKQRLHRARFAPELG